MRGFYTVSRREVVTDFISPEADWLNKEKPEC